MTNCLVTTENSSRIAYLDSMTCRPHPSSIVENRPGWPHVFIPPPADQIRPGSSMGVPGETRSSSALQWAYHFTTSLFPIKMSSSAGRLVCVKCKSDYSSPKRPMLRCSSCKKGWHTCTFPRTDYFYYLGGDDFGLTRHCRLSRSRSHCGRVQSHVRG